MTEAAVLDKANFLVSQLVFIAVCIKFSRNAGKLLKGNFTFSSPGWLEKLSFFFFGPNQLTSLQQLPTMAVNSNVISINALVYHIHVSAYFLPFSMATYLISVKDTKCVILNVLLIKRKRNICKVTINKQLKRIVDR